MGCLLGGPTRAIPRAADDRLPAGAFRSTLRRVLTRKAATLLLLLLSMGCKRERPHPSPDEASDDTTGSAAAQQTPPPTPAPSEPEPLPLPGEAEAAEQKLPPVTRWGSVVASPTVHERKLGPHCRVQRVQPRFSGGPAGAALDRLEENVAAEVQALEQALFSDAPCEGATKAVPHGFESTYELGAERHGHVSLELQASAYTGGAHPNGLARCFVISLPDAKLLKLQELLTPRGRAELEARTTERLAREHGVARLSEAGFFVDRVTVQNPYGLCLTEKGILVQFQPYEVAPHALGYPSAEFPWEEVRPLFDPKRMPNGW